MAVSIAVEWVVAVGVDCGAVAAVVTSFGCADGAIIFVSGILDATLSVISGRAVVVVPVNVVVTNSIPKCGPAEGHML